MQLLEIPYERQETDWMCGAAALCMVYRSLGLPATQAEVWSYIRPVESRRGARPQRLIWHAMQQGFSAQLLRAARPWQLLGRFFRPELRVIVLHRRGFDAFGLHSSVLRGLDEDGVVLHDPYGRPDRHLEREDFLALWGPHHRSSLARGYLLAVVARQPESSCPCGQDPEVLSCPHCQQSVRLLPAIAATCGESDWQELYCPHCEGLLAEQSAE